MNQKQRDILKLIIIFVVGFTMIVIAYSMRFAYLDQFDGKLIKTEQ